MKLLTKINRNYLKYGTLLFLVIDLFAVFFISYSEREETLQELKYGAMEVVKVIENHGHFPHIPPMYEVEVLKPDQVINESFKDTYMLELDKQMDNFLQNQFSLSMDQDNELHTSRDTLGPDQFYEGFFTDTIMFDPEDQEMDNFLEYRFYAKINGENYIITHRHRVFTYPNLILRVTLAITSLLAVIFLAMFLYTRIMSNHLWGVFERNLESLKNYSFSTPDQLKLELTNIDEFDGLNKVLEKMSDRLVKDYHASKEFSANAAHELQTPLAIIRNKCETLFSHPNLPEEVTESLREIFVATNKLSGITKALLLLAKIDHGQFNENEEISLSGIIHEKVEFYEDIIEDKKLKVKVEVQEESKLQMDMRLASLWIQNIVVNAIKHSERDKEVLIRLSKEQLSITNFGEEPISQPDQIFNRFYKESNGHESTGIGLAIVKKITEHYDMRIEYHYSEYKHTFTFLFPSC